MGRDTYDRVNTEDEGEIVHAACSFQSVVPVASTVHSPQPNSFVSSATQEVSRLASNLTWTDNFYEAEPDIVAAFDLDHEQINLYKSKDASKHFWWALFFFGLAVFYAAIDVIVLACLFLSFSLFYCMNIKQRKSDGSGLHMAITSSSIRYDQENPLLTTEISLKSISICTVANKKIKKYPWSPEVTVNLVMLQIVGKAVPKIYIGLKDPKGFARLVMSLKNQGQQGQPDQNFQIV